MAYSQSQFIQQHNYCVRSSILICQERIPNYALFTLSNQRPKFPCYSNSCLQLQRRLLVGPNLLHPTGPKRLGHINNEQCTYKCYLLSIFTAYRFLGCKKGGFLPCLISHKTCTGVFLIFLWEKEHILIPMLLRLQSMHNHTNISLIHSQEQKEKKQMYRAKPFNLRSLSALE